ncbi:MAG TPA: hypothetical protein VF600_16880 [Abditibacteriaceae bacterium]|jgi:hypothetical protein
MQAYRIETTIQQDGTLTLQHLPFQAGEPVEIIVLARAPEASSSNDTSAPYSEVISAIRQRQKARAHQPRSYTEVDAALQEERDNWDN